MWGLSVHLLQKVHEKIFSIYHFVKKGNCIERNCLFAVATLLAFKIMTWYKYVRADQMNTPGFIWFEHVWQYKCPIIWCSMLDGKRNSVLERSLVCACPYDSSHKGRCSKDWVDSLISRAQLYIQSCYGQELSLKLPAIVRSRMREKGGTTQIVK